jgi:16S rRNA processing protein RimM
MSDDRICVGSIGGSFGVHGEVRIKSYCAEPAVIADYSPLWTKDGRQVSIEITRPVKNGYAANMSGVSSKEQADALKGTDLFAERDQLPALPDDEYYHADLIGLTVLDTGGAVLGRVKSVQNFGASDLLEITAPGLQTPALLPFTLVNVPTVDLASGRIIADPPEGIFPEAERD